MTQKVKKNEKQKKNLSNINILFNWRNDAMTFVEDYGSMILETERKTAEGKQLKIFAPKITNSSCTSKDR